MKEYVIVWDAGYGQSVEVVQAENLKEAEEQAYECWREEAESQSTIFAQELTEEVAEQYGLDDQWPPASSAVS